jgi:hypothetical protein
VVGLSKDENDTDDGDWLDARGRVVFRLVTVKLTCDTEVYFAKGILADVRGPHLGQHLAHHTYGVLHRSRPDVVMF